MSVDVANGSCIRVNLALKILDLNQLVIDIELIGLHFPSIVINLILKVSLQSFHFDLNLKHPVFNLIELRLAILGGFVINRHFQEIDPVVELLVLFLKIEDELSVSLTLVEDGLEKFPHEPSYFCLKCHEVQVLLSMNCKDIK